MGANSEDRRRLLRITEGNLRNNHLNVHGHYDFFPDDVVGGARRSKARGGSIELLLDGLQKAVFTDIGSDAKTGRPRGFLRCRSEVGKFFKLHKVAAGSEVALERLSERSYRLTLPNGHASKPEKPKAAEFFAGIGLVRLALERQGWDVVFANDIDPDKAEMYRHNWPTC